MSTGELPKTFARVATIATLCRNGKAVHEPDIRVEVTFTLTSIRYDGCYEYTFRDRRGNVVRDGYPTPMVETCAFQDVVRAWGGIVRSWGEP